jgi:hypothetical protein
VANKPSGRVGLWFQAVFSRAGSLRSIVSCIFLLTSCVGSISMVQSLGFKFAFGQQGSAKRENSMALTGDDNVTWPSHAYLPNVVVAVSKTSAIVQPQPRATSMPSVTSMTSLLNVTAKLGVDP